MKQYFRLIPVLAAVYALCVACATKNAASGLYVFGPVILGFVLHALTRRLIRRNRAPKWLCFAPLLLLGIPVAGAAYEACLQEYLWQLVALLWLIGGLLYVLGWVSAFGWEEKKDE